MEIYLWLLILPLILALAERAPARLKPLGWALIWLGLVLFLGLRRDLGHDWNNYVLMFQRAGAYALPEAVTLSDPGYMLLTGMVSRVGLALPVANLVCAGIFATGLLKFVRIQPSPPLALAIAVPVLVAIVGLTTTRQSVAVGLLMWALALYVSGARRLPPLLLLGALLFHWTAVILLPLVPMMLARRFNHALVVFSAAVTGAVLAIALATVPALSERIAYLDQSSGAPFRTGLTMAAAVILFLGWRRISLSEDERRVASFLTALGLFSAALIPVLSVAADRLGFYAIPLQIIVFARLASLVSSEAGRIAVRAAVAGTYVILLAGWLALSGYRACLVPYRSYLADPAALRDAMPDRHRRPAPCLASPPA